MTKRYEMNQAQLMELALTRCGECRGSEVDREGEACGCRDEFNVALSHIELPPRMEQATLAQVDWQLIQPDKLRSGLQTYSEHVTDYLDNNLGLCLTGPVGCGKTHLVVGLGKLACALGWNPLFVSVPEWFQALRDSYADPRQGQEKKLLAKLKEADLLILDDLGAERPSDWVRERLYLVINDRYVRERSTWVTTNLALPDLGESVGERILSRLVGDAVVFTLDGSDYRKTQKQSRLTQLKTKLNDAVPGRMAVSRVPMAEEE